MPASSSKANILNLDNIIHSGTLISRGRKLRTLRCVMGADRTFARIWHGSVPSTLASPTLQSLWSVDAHGRLIYRGKIYNKDSWATYTDGGVIYYGPPRFIRGLGRSAKEYPNPRNTHPCIRILTKNHKSLIVDECPKCGGELVYDNNMELYCRECGLIY